MDKQKLMWLGIGILAGIVFRSQVDRIPLVNRIPTA